MCPSRPRPRAASPPAARAARPISHDQSASQSSQWENRVTCSPSSQSVSLQRRPNSWTVAAEVGNSHAYGCAGATDGEGKEVLCSSSAPTFPLGEESPSSALADTCRKPCPGNTSEACGNDWMLRLVDYTCERADTPPPPKMPAAPSGPLYLAGVFSGCGAESCTMNPSQRAAISPPLPMHVLGHQR